MYCKIIKEINIKYFDNKMSKEWKKFVKELLKKYKFDNVVILTLFDYCNSKCHLEEEYIARVAEIWYRNNIITNEDLENFCIRYERIVKLKRNIKKYMRREITQFEEAYLEKWVIEYGLNERDIISALKMSKSFSKADMILFKRYTHNKTHRKEK